MGALTVVFALLSVHVCVSVCVQCLCRSRSVSVY